MTKDVRLHLSQIGRGRVVSATSRQKMSLGTKRQWARLRAAGWVRPDAARKTYSANLLQRYAAGDTMGHTPEARSRAGLSRRRTRARCATAHAEWLTRLLELDYETASAFLTAVQLKLEPYLIRDLSGGELRNWLAPLGIVNDSGMPLSFVQLRSRIYTLCASGPR